MGERSGQFWSQVRPLLLWNLTVVPAMVLSVVLMPSFGLDVWFSTGVFLVLVGCGAALAAAASTLPANQTPRGRRTIVAIAVVSLLVAVLVIVVAAIMMPAHAIAPLALILATAWLPGALAAAYGLWVRRHLVAG